MADVDSEVLWALAMNRHRDFLREAAGDRRVRLARPTGPRLGGRLAVVFADRLIALGGWLKWRYDDRPAAAHLYGRSHP